MKISRFVFVCVLLLLGAVAYIYAQHYHCETYNTEYNCRGNCECDGTLWEHEPCGFSCMDPEWVLHLCNFQSEPDKCRVYQPR